MPPVSLLERKQNLFILPKKASFFVLQFMEKRSTMILQKRKIKEKERVMA